MRNTPSGLGRGYSWVMAQRSWMYFVCTLLFLSVAHPSGQARPRRLRPEAGIVAFDLNAPVPQRLLELGVGLVRGSCSWENLEPAREAFDWTCADNVIGGAERLGMRSYMTVTCTPGWANGHRGCREIPTDILRIRSIKARKLSTKFRLVATENLERRI